ncbi:YbjN domain-containing protein [Megasphaera sp. UPII 135-E]|uniref:YbjN domain-containing protein n=1 Tax=Megasphaera sp. UPII 135-E TaxID=1000569 RepID=UPI00021A2D63|nr:YbjN domain-containing protein [Megasphaera sp. UPII 135-E]EGS35674.1 hypothetical protein HMPREF1040_0102 [Megasphaera sp. UPII 135-E]
MNKKAESFKKALDEKKINDFSVEELKNDELHTVLFRSKLVITGTEFNTIFVLDDSVYSMIRVFIAPNAVNEKNKNALYTLLNEYNGSYKAFKYVIDTEGNITLDLCIINETDTVNLDLVYALYDTIITHLNDNYKQIVNAF